MSTYDDIDEEYARSTSTYQRLGDGDRIICAFFGDPEIHKFLWPKGGKKRPFTEADLKAGLRPVIRTIHPIATVREFLQKREAPVDHPTPALRLYELSPTEWRQLMKHRADLKREIDGDAADKEFRWRRLFFFELSRIGEGSSTQRQLVPRRDLAIAPPLLAWLDEAVPPRIDPDSDDDEFEDSYTAKSTARVETPKPQAQLPPPKTPSSEELGARRNAFRQRCTALRDRGEASFELAKKAVRICREAIPSFGFDTLAEEHFSIVDQLIAQAERGEEPQLPAAREFADDDDFS
jgi:hypothetical protein